MPDPATDQESRPQEANHLVEAAVPRQPRRGWLTKALALMIVLSLSVVFGIVIHQIYQGGHSHPPDELTNGGPGPEVKTPKQRVVTPAKAENGLPGSEARPAPKEQPSQRSASEPLVGDPSAKSLEHKPPLGESRNSLGMTMGGSSPGRS